MRHKAINIELFAGGGGASTGIKMALGRSPDIVIDHDPKALAMHKANHPDSKHLCGDAWRIQPRHVTMGRPVHWIWASPECTHHSVAKGGDAKRDTKSRDMVWIVEKYAKEVFPTGIIIENVQGFLRWGPCNAEGIPIKALAGRHFRAFVNRMRRLGYRVEYRLLRADDYGAATIRKRLFIIARRDGKPIVWPKPTHGPGRVNPFTPVSACIDFANTGTSVFSRKKTLSAATLRRIAGGICHYGRKPFIFTYYGEKKPGELRGCGSDAQVGTQTTANRHYLVTPLCIGADEGAVHRFHGPIQNVDSHAALLDCMAQNEIADVHYRALTTQELFKIQGFPEDYSKIEGVAADGTPLRLTRGEQLRSCGNSVCPPVAAALVRANYEEYQPVLPSLPLMAWAAKDAKTVMAVNAVDVGQHEDMAMATQDVEVAELGEICEENRAGAEQVATDTPHAGVLSLDARGAEGLSGQRTTLKQPRKNGFTHDRVTNGKDEWLTPKHLLEQLGAFDLDPCSPVIRPWDTAAKHYTVLDNGLKQEWEGRVWLNPPYGAQTGRWLARLAEHGDGIALVFARTETKAFHRYVWHQASAMLFLEGRLTFHHVNGNAADSSAGAPSVLIAYGEQNVACLMNLRCLGAVVMLRLGGLNGTSPKEELPEIYRFGLVG